MVRVTFTVLALGVSALAATVHNRREIDVRAEPEIMGGAVPDLSLYSRQDKAPDSPQIQKLRDDKKAISPELDAAKQEAKKAKDSIPQDVKDKMKAARQKVKDTFNGLPQDKKDQLKAKDKEIKAARNSANPSAAPSAAPNPAPAPAPAPNP